MCGIIGIIPRKIGGLYAKDLDLFEQGLVINTIRGKDSVGAFTAFRNKQAMAIKHGSNPFELFKTKEWSSFRTDAMNKGRFIIGHNRASTRGITNTDNAHPFVEENIILVHNGTIFNEKELTENKVEVDSNAIAHALVENEPQDVFPYINGAFACVWFDTTKQRLFVLRNDQRPLTLITTDDSYMLSSEPWIMAAPAARQDRKLGDFTEILPGDLYSFDMEGTFTVTKLDMTKKAGRPGAAKHSATGTTSSNAGSNTTKTEPNSVIPFKTNGTDTSTDTTTDFFKAGTALRAETTSPENRTLLRQALMLQHKRKMQESTRSTVCALTSLDELVSRRTSTTENDSTTNSTGLNEDSLQILEEMKSLQSPEEMVGWAGPILPCDPTSDDREMLNLSKNVIQSPLYPPGRVVIFRINKNVSDFKSRVRFTGKLMEPGMEMVDVMGFVPQGTMYTPATLCIGRIFFTKVSVHGPEIFVTNVERCKFTAVHTTEVAEHVWNMAYREGQCDSCGNELRLQDKTFTAVSTKAIFGKTKSGIPLNTLTCMCADCIQDKLPEGSYRESFIAKRRNLKAAQEKSYVLDPRDPVQTGIVLREIARSEHRSGTRVEGPATLQ